MYKRQIYGRGVADNKAGAISSLYAVRALMAAGFAPKMAIRLIFGCDEESGMGDMPYYLAHEKAPKYAFSPDAGFPLYYAEKGRIDGRVTAAFTASTALVRVEGGVAANVVPADATAWLRGYTAADLPASAYIDLHGEDGLAAVSYTHLDVYKRQAGFAVPAEGTMREVNVYARFKKRLPQQLSLIHICFGGRCAIGQFSACR